MRRFSICTAIILILLSAGAAFTQTALPTPVKTANTATADPTDSKDIYAPDDKRTAAAAAGYTRPNAETRQKRYINGLFGPVTLARQVATAGISTWRNSPEEWGDHWEGFGRRVASNFGKNAIKQTTIFALDSALKVDSHYYRSRKKDFGSKLKNALISPVTARNPEGKRVIGIPRITGTYASSIIAAETWYPDRFDWKDGLKSGTISLGFNAAFNLFKEFVKK